MKRPVMTDEWRERLIEAANKSGRSDRDISLAAGLGPSFMNELRRTDKVPTVKRVLMLAAELNVSLAAVFLGRDDISPQDEEMLALAHQVSPEEREALLTLWRARRP